MARFCEALPELTAVAAEEGFSAELLAALRRARAAAGPPAAAVVEEFATAIGIISRSRGITIPGQPPAPPPRGGYECPRGSCDRRAQRRPGGARPVCELFGEAMIFRS